MRKIWFFVEGDSEKSLVECLMRNFFYETFQEERDISKFIIQDFSKDVFFCFNCESVDKIPHKINEEFYKIEKSGSMEIIIICDIEKEKCNTNRKQKIESTLKSEIDINMISYIIFNPSIEALYFSCIPILKKVLQKTIVQKFQNNDKINLEITEAKKSYYFELQSLFKKYDVKYIESDFAKNFFSSVNFESCENPVIRRLIHFING